MVRTNSDGQTNAQTPNCHCDNYVSIRASGLDKSHFVKQLTVKPAGIALDLKTRGCGFDSRAGQPNKY